MKRWLVRAGLMLGGFALFTGGFVFGGIRAGHTATRQAYYSDLAFFSVIARSLDQGNASRASELSHQAVRAVLSVVNTIEAQPSLSLYFLLGEEDQLLKSDNIRKIRDAAVAVQPPSSGGK